jgi:mono/diheme cytochrome c family protein
VNSRVYTYRLGGTAEPTPIELEPAPVPEPPSLQVTQAELGLGARTYARRCASCHGIGAISGGVLPDLRRSALLQSEDEWRQVVLGGSRTDLGMPALSPILDPHEAELTRAYVARQAALLLETAGPGSTR